MMTRFLIIAVLLSLPVSLALAQEAVPEKPLNATEASPIEKATAAESSVEETTAPEKKAKAAKPEKGIQEMTEEEKAAAGLDKLSPAELEYLNEWMRNKQKGAEKKAAEQATVQATEKAKAEAQREVKEEKHHSFLHQDQEALVSHVNGEMTALNGRTIVTLEDGTRWKQANRDDRYRPRVTDRPAVAVFHTQFGYKMRIEGMPDFYVDPVRD